MSITISPLAHSDAPDLLAIFNRYVETSMAAFPEQPLPAPIFARLLESASDRPAFVAKDGERCAGFALLRPFHPLPTFSRTTELSIFLHPEFRGRGIGRKLLEHLIAAARSTGILTILAPISSLNPESVAFHQALGFRECGCFQRVGRKKGMEFDLRYFQYMC